MSDNFDKFRAVAAECGYELVHGQEGYGTHFFGLMIAVKMSNRKFDSDHDGLALYRAADQIKDNFDTVTARLDPEGKINRSMCRQQIENIYKDAGVDAIYMEELPNGYCSKPCCLNKPWFRVTSRIGHVVIGWRKRVMSIEWGESTVAKSGAEMFPDEDVTKLETGIHAWGQAKATEYIKRLHGAK